MQNVSRPSTFSKTATRNNRTETRSRAKDELRRVIGAVDKTVVRKWEKRWVMLKDSSISVWKWVPVASPPGGVVAPKLITAPKTTATTTLPNGAGACDSNDGDSAGGVGVAGTPPTAGQTATVGPVATDETTMQSAASVENNSNEDTADVNMTMLNNGEEEEEEDSNAPIDFSDIGAFDSDSQTFDRVDYTNHHKNAIGGGTTRTTTPPNDDGAQRRGKGTAAKVAQPTDFSQLRKEETGAGAAHRGEEEGKLDGLANNTADSDEPQQQRGVETNKIYQLQ